MDCMNSIGEVVTIDDVDDMGGSVSLRSGAVGRIGQSHIFPLLSVDEIVAPSSRLNLWSILILVTVLDIYTCIRGWHFTRAALSGGQQRP
jgi:hypothetical protein